MIPSLKDKLVAVRIDINSPFQGRIEKNDRIVEHAKTIKLLKSMKARIVLLAHQGRKGKNDFVSLKNHLPILRRLAGSIEFAGFDINKAREVKPGRAVLMENVRFLDNQKVLADLNPDYFMLDAFSVAHRNEYSITGFSCQSLPGPVFSMELRGIANSRKPATFLLGGAKEEEVIDVIKARKDSLFLLGGIVGMKTAASVYGFPFADRKLGRIAKRENVFHPIDFAVGKRKRVETRNPEEMPKDIGRETIKLYSALLNLSQRIVFSKPVGVYEEKPFSLGTKRLYNFIASLKTESIGGGGNTRDAIRKLRIKNSFTYLSLSGGAFLEYASNKKLPGLRRLEKDGWDEESIKNAWKKIRQIK